LFVCLFVYKLDCHDFSNLQEGHYSIFRISAV